jgi:amino acid adenylation domain-containing protein/non-ribosomal peptide synthase protein (TIGR01720 family)
MSTLIDLYELSPMQQGMLFHSIYESGLASGLYIEQRTCQIQGHLDTAAFQQAWQAIVDRHAILRTGFYWEEVEKPLQAVFDAAELTWIELDWQQLTELEQSQQLAIFLERDRTLEFTLSQPSLMRFALIRLSPETYQFVWTHHHLLMDGWCNAILLKEVIQFYEGSCQGRSVDLATPPNFREYINWLQHQDLTQAQQFWQKHLQGFTEPTDLSAIAQFSRSSHLSSGLSTHELERYFCETTTREIQSFCQQHRLTVNTLIQAAWAFLLKSYTQQSDIVFGTTVSGRPPSLVGIESTIGLFINTLPVRVQFLDDVEVLTWLRQLQDQQLEREQYSYSSLVDIQAGSEIAKGQPLFESLIVVENYPVSIQTALQGQRSLKLDKIQGFAKTNYPLTLSVIPGQQLLLQISFTAQFVPEAIARLLEQMQTILQGIITSPQQTIAKLSLLTDSDRAQITTWNQTKHPYAQISVIEQFEHQVQSTPEAIALLSSDQALTYAELNVKANQLAHYLQAQHIGRGKTVAICLERSPKLIISLLAVLKTGAIYLPLDPSYPAERLRFIQSDAQVALTLTQTEFDLAFQPEGFGEDSKLNLSLEINLEDPAYIIYTSGSTGKPKGVIVPHRALANYVNAAIEKFALTPSDRVLQFASISFDAAAEEIYPTLLSGATLVLRSPEMISTAATFLETSHSLRLTVLDLPTAYWHQLTQQAIAESLRIPDTLRLLIIGGEAANADRFKAWQTYTQGRIRLINTYGPTETAIVATWWEANLSIEQHADIPIGKPIPNVQTYVLDQHRQLVAPGIPGELYIGGMGVAHGYLNQPQLTQDCFIDPTKLDWNGHFDPYGLTEQTGKYLYKTGDRVRQLPTGELQFLGRIDQQLKLRGFRIEPAEIETILHQHPAVQTSIVTLHPNATSPQLLAYILPAPQAPCPTPSELRRHLANHLPTHMIPATFIALEALPLTSSGKLDRQAVLRISPNPSSQPQKPTRPRTASEEILVGIWTKVLAVEVGIDDNFFELGGHSLSATQVIAQVRNAFGTEVPLRQLFEQPTIALFAAGLSQRSHHRSQPQIRRQPRTAPLPLSYAQQRQWFLAQLEPESPLYNIPAAVRVVGELDLNLLQDCLNQIIQRHESLRTSFTDTNGSATQVIHPSFQLEVPVIDLSLLSSEAQALNTETSIEASAKQLIPIGDLPLLRIKVLRLTEREHIILLTFHHIIADGWSIGIFLKELTALYGDRTHGRTPDLPELAIQYADFATWQRTQDFSAQLVYWQQQLSHLPILDLPTDRPRPAVRSLQGSTYRFTLSPAVTNALKQLSIKLNSTLFMTLLTAFKVLLHRYTDNADIVIGTAIANRSQAETEDLIGFFINTLALRTDLSGNPTFSELVARVREVALSAYAHQDLPFEQLVEALKLQRSLSYTPIFQVMFVLQNAPFVEQQVEGLSWTPILTDSQTAKFDLTLSMQETATGLTASLEYSLDLFELATIQRLAGHFQILLEAIALEPDQPISHLSLLTDSEQAQLIAWNQTQTDYPQTCVHQLFEQQAQRTPDAIALVYLDQHWTYRSLNQEANQLAHYLVSLGASIETSVGVYLERSPAAIISILAVLKAGATYIPLDPSLPSERLQFILQDAQVNLVILQSNLPFVYPHQSIHLDIDATKIQQHSEDNLDSKVTSDQLAYIMYTSGSTGIPKGVCIPHRGIVRLVKNTNYVTLDSHQVILQTAPLGFDASTFEIWGALLNGGKLVMSPSIQLDELQSTLQQYQVNTLWLTSGLFNLIVNERIEVLATIQQLLVGGDVLSQIHLRQVRTTYPHIRLINGYGPTEGTTFTCCRTITADDLIAATVPIGQSIANTQVYILDAAQQPVPIGVPGELYIAGAGLARGYLNQPQLTAAQFTPAPQFILSSDSLPQSHRLYRTGDRARYQSDGTIEYLGRLDQQVKIRGFRIELGEVEAALLQHPKVQSVSVTCHTFPETGQKHLIAYAVLQQNINPLSQTLRQFLSEKLPDYMIPSFYVALDRIPLTANGKVDYRALPPLEISSDDRIGDRPATLPSTPTEAILAKIWADVLSVDQAAGQVSTTANFFELGGDSILAIQIVSRVQQAGFQLTPKQLFQHQTIAELATVVTVQSPIIAEQGLITGEIPLMPIQQWFFEQALTNVHHFNQAVLLTSDTPLNVTWLKQAIDHVQIHHDALRLQFKQTETGWQQTIAAEPSASFTYFDYSQLPCPVEQLQDTASTLQTSLHLSGVLMRFALFRLGQGQGDRLMIVCHHLLIDGIAWRILMEDIQTAYAQLSQGSPIQLPAKTTAVKQWAEYLQTSVERFQPDLEFWLTQNQPTYLPIDQVPTDKTNTQTGYVEIEFTQAITQTLLTKTVQAYGTRVNEVLLTALVLTLQKWTNQSTFLLDIEGHGREPELISEQLDLSRTVGWFTAIFPVQFTLPESSQHQIGEGLKQVKEQLRSVPQQGVSYGILRYLASDTIKSQLRSLPAAPISFNYLGQFQGQFHSATNHSSNANHGAIAELKLASESIGATQSANNSSPYSFEISASIIEEKLRLNWGYNRQQYHHETIVDLVDLFQRSLLDLIEHCQAPDAGGYTPSDFALAALDQHQLDAVLAAVTFGGES